MGWFKITLDRSPREVLDILREFTVGESTGHLADDFISIPITDPVLDQIRQDFEDLVHQQSWEPQLPFPEAGVAALQELIHRAAALAGL